MAKTANPRRFTAELLKGYKRGINRVVYSSQPHLDAEVEYSPRSKHDAEPWVFVDKERPSYRMSGKECHLLNLRFQTTAEGMDFVVTDSVSGREVVRAHSRYAAEDAAARFEANPVLAEIVLGLAPEQGSEVR